MTRDRDPSASQRERLLPGPTSRLAGLALCAAVLLGAGYFGRPADRDLDSDTAERMSVAVPPDVRTWDEFFALYPFPEDGMRSAIIYQNGETIPRSGIVVLPLDQ